MNASEFLAKLDERPLSRTQIWVIFCTIFLNALDGFDLLSISFAAPGIANEWNITRAQLGVVLSMELVGMGIGSMLMGSFADRFGRKATTLICLTIMFAGMQAAAHASGLTELSIYRVGTGIGLGGMLSVNNALVAEFSNASRRQLSISLMVIGFSIGGVVGGFIATQILAHYDWRMVFQFGAVVTAACIPLVALTVPESAHWLAKKQPPKALDRLNKVLAKFGHEQLATLPQAVASESSSSWRDIFAPNLRRGTILIAIIYVLHAITFYFTLKWAPKIVADLGYHPSTAGTVLVWGNVGGIFGGILFGLLASRLGIKRSFTFVLVLAGLTVVLFGNTATSLFNLSLFNALNGFFCVAGLAGSYACMAQIYPAQTRGFGTGFTLGVGRGGAILSPILAGVLFSADLSLATVATAMGAGSIAAALFVSRLPVR